ncbi:DUF1232 domain-containing protein [Azospirillum sp. RWY-5-1]|uniref:DUF1232 domain-containing protein n=1 Tax=Azospirillum oleiclasticum TaxID=2735135 RepID=A0ABX2TEX8_9PROT|nr:YkvA family protein [Azospirillum oleiclasticum]NYZ15334.1 DUF1232 domain-containing protein [Azospirillum oleiclasticum]NYZ21245.1 DUF1232 domain-containing protein [Azospirillum oleiclasticum]
MTEGTAEPPFDPLKVARDETLVRRRFWDKLRANVKRLPFLEHALAAWYCAIDPATPATAKAVLMGALAYFIMPADLVPDWLLVVGFTDDAAVVMAAIQAVRANLRPEHYDRARAALREEERAAA